MKTSKEELNEVRREVKRMIKPGDTIYTILRHCSSNGMNRRISLIAIVNGKPVSLDWYAEKLGIANRSRNHEGLTVSGCGMDMGFHLVYNFASVMYPHGFNCAGKERCRSNDHTNGSNDYNRRKKHSSGGYAYRHSWM